MPRQYKTKPRDGDHRSKIHDFDRVHEVLEMPVMMTQNQTSRFLDAAAAGSMTLEKKCAHCKISFAPKTSQRSDFCCAGCEGAWTIVNGLGLESFYKMTLDSTLKPAVKTRQDYGIYDSLEFQSTFVERSQDFKKNHSNASILVEGITCYACIWLIRQAMDRHFKSKSSSTVGIEINQSTGASIVTWDQTNIKLSDIVQFIETLGYQVLPHRSKDSKSDQSAMIRSGVGLFVMMNVMSFALVEYFSSPENLDPGIQNFLRWLSLILTTVTLVWPGREFFTNTWRCIIARTPNIDAPILLGLLTAFAWSSYHTILGTGVVYFDSICAIVALVITGRFVQQNVLRRNQTRMAGLINPKDGWVLVQKQSNGSTQWIPSRASDIQKGETIRILPGEMFPVKAICSTSCAEVSFEQLRGEVDWKTIKSGEQIPAGSLNGSIPIDVVAHQSGAESYTESLSKSIERALLEKGRYHQWSDRAAWFLFIAVFIVAAIVLIVLAPYHFDEAVKRTVALLLVACPCTFAIGVPLTFGTAMTQALKDGVLFKSQISLEKLAGIREFIFDKTGTLTEGTISVKTCSWAPNVSKETQQELLSQLGNLDLYSSHQVAMALAKYARTILTPSTVQPTTIREIQGEGLQLEIGTSHISIGKDPHALDEHGTFESGSTVIKLNGKPCASFILDDVTRPESLSVVQALQLNGCKVEILSGDSLKRTQSVAQTLSIETKNTHSNATPGSKLNFVRNAATKNQVVMIGNGFNDSGAMSQAQVSIAVAGSSSSAMNSSDICLLKNDLNLVSDALRIAKNTQRRLKIVFSIALFYNVLGLTLAAFGYVSPVVAAILMPISSLTITKIATGWTISSQDTHPSQSPTGKQ